LDEAFLDVTENHFNLPSATLIAKEIRERIRQEIGLNASAGISYNKFLAKVASDLNKPNGQAVIPPEKANVFLEKLPIEKFYGVGKVMAQKMKNLGIHNGWDLKQYSLSFLVKRFGKSGLHYYDIVRGVHQSEVKPNRIRKSLGVEKTFEKDIFEMADIENALMDLLKVLFFRLEKAKTQGRTVTLKIKYNDFSLLSRSKSHPDILALAEIQQIVLTLMEQEQITKPIRLLGISISNLGGESIELTFGEQLSFDY
ncbi:MAG: DNA polymerase IV, partial [Cyclobacteriaceae bacterium]